MTATRGPTATEESTPPPTRTATEGLITRAAYEALVARIISDPSQVLVTWPHSEQANAYMLGIAHTLQIVRETLIEGGGQ